MKRVRSEMSDLLADGVRVRRGLGNRVGGAFSSMTRALGRSTVAFGRWRRIAFGAVSRALFSGSLRLWGAGQRTLGLLSSAWTGAGKAARGAGLGFRVAFRALGGGLRTMFGILRANPVGIALTLLATAATMIYERWSSFEWFFGEIKAAMTDFKGFWEDLKNAVSAAMAEIKPLIDGSVLDPARSKVTDWMEATAHWWNGTTPARADAPVATRRQMMEAEIPPWPMPPQLPAVSPRSGTTVNRTDNSTTTIHIVQQPGESAAALARQTAQELERNRQVRERGLMHDLVPTS